MKLSPTSRLSRYIREHNATSSPFVWTKPADSILTKLARLPMPSGVDRRGTRLANNLVRTGQERLRQDDPHRLRCPAVDEEFQLPVLDRQVTRLGAFDDLIHHDR